MYEISLFSGMFCKICGKELGYLNPKYKKYYKGNPQSSNSYFIMKPQTITGEYRKKCFDCFYKEFGRLPHRPNLLTKDCDWLLEIDLSNHRKTKAVTKKNLIRKYGLDEGLKRWESYCKKQSDKNKFEHKQEKYGWNKEQFDKFNKSRAVTLDNCIKRHGEEKGIELFENYCIKQKTAGCSLEWFIEKHGEKIGKEVYKKINAKKTLSLETFIRKYGLIDGEKKWIEYVENRPTAFYSKSSNNFFNELEIILGNRYNCRYSNTEYGIYDEIYKKYYKYDFCLFENKKIIEYNGTYWHADPRVYKSNEKISYPNGLVEFVKNVWIYDDIKHQCAKRRGFDIFTVWELDVTNNREGVIEQCLNFIQKL